MFHFTSNKALLSGFLLQFNVMDDLKNIEISSQFVTDPTSRSGNGQGTY